MIQIPVLHKHVSRCRLFEYGHDKTLMRKILTTTTITIFLLTVLYFGCSYLNSYVGWYSHEHYKHRKGSMDINEAKSRGVFVKELSFTVDGYS